MQSSFEGKDIHIIEEALPTHRKSHALSMDRVTMATTDRSRSVDLCLRPR